MAFYYFIITVALTPVLETIYPNMKCHSKHKNGKEK